MSPPPTAATTVDLILGPAGRGGIMIVGDATAHICAIGFNFGKYAWAPAGRGGIMIVVNANICVE